MTPRDVIVTSLLLGAFVTTGGVYGILLSVGYAMRESSWRTSARIAYAAQCAVAATIVLATPLDWWWKALIASSGAIYYFIPPLTWRYLVRLHQAPEEPLR